MQEGDLRFDNLKFTSSNMTFTPKFQATNNISDGGYERGLEEGEKKGYASGYEQGEKDGYSEGYDKGLVDGNTFYDAFWDTYQQNGARTDYQCAFEQQGWKDEIFNPKHSMKPRNANRMFYYSSLTNLDDIEIDFSSCGDFGNAFAYSKFTHLPIINASKIISSEWVINSIFNGAKRLVFIEKFIIPTTFKNVCNSWFTGCTSLTHVIFEGNIPTPLNLKDTQIDLESAISFIVHLQNHVGTNKEFAYSISFSPKTKALLEAEGNTAPNGGTWFDEITLKGWIY